MSAKADNRTLEALVFRPGNDVGHPMYIPPGFTVITCEPVDEEAFRAWAADNGGVWHPAEDNPHSYRPAHIGWNFGLRHDMETALRILNDEEKAEWAPLMHMPPQGVVEVQLFESLHAGSEQCASVLRSLFNQ